MPTSTPTGVPAPSTGVFNNGMALSPTQVQQFRQQYGIQSQAPTQSTSGARNPWATYDSAVGTQNPGAQGGSKDLGDLAAEGMTSGVNQITRGVQTGADALSANDGSFGGTAKAVGGVLEGGLDAAAGTIKTGLAPFGALLQKALEYDPAAAKPGSAPNTPFEQDMVPKVAAWAKDHPEAVKNLQNIITVGSTLVGGEAGVLGKGGDMTVSEAASSIKNAVGDTVNAVKNAPKTVKDTLAARAAAKEQASLDQSVKATMPHNDKAQRMGDLLDTNKDVEREGALGTSKTQSTPEDIKRGTVAHEYIKGVKDPVDQRNAIIKGIKDTSNKTNAFLDQNKTPSNFADMRDYLESNNTPSSNLAKDPVAEDNYKRVTEQALNTLYKTMKSSAEESGDFGALQSGKDIRQARIEIDQQIKSELNENTFGTPQYKGIKAAAIDTRNLLNRMEEDLQRYPGQLEQLNKYNKDLATLRERGVSTNAKGEVTPEAQAALKEKYGLKSTPESEAQATQLADYHDKMSNLYDALYNVAERYQASLGKNQVQEFAKNHPIITGTVKAAGRAAGLGAGVHLVP